MSDDEPNPYLADQSDAELAWWAYFDYRSTRYQVFRELMNRHPADSIIWRFADAGWRTLSRPMSPGQESNAEYRTMALVAILAHVDPNQVIRLIAPQPESEEISE